MIRGLIRWHKWLSWLLSFFLIFFALSGILLNHRHTLSGIDISRGLLLPSYHYKNWNHGSMIGSVARDSLSHWVYGYSGIWLTDHLAQHFVDFNKGLPNATDQRSIRALARAPQGSLFALTPYHLYRYTYKGWEKQAIAVKKDDALLTDVVFKGDSMLVLSRSALLLSLPPYKEFSLVPLQAPEGYKPEASLFRTLWMLHSGTLFGSVGIFVVDIIGLLLLILIVTGLLITLYRIMVRRNKDKKIRNNALLKKWNTSLQWHNWMGKSFFILLLLITLTGMFLRPPLLIPIARTKVPTIPGTALHSDNPWKDKLRKLRYDSIAGEWLLSTSEGFFSLRHWNQSPQRITTSPPVSVMGVNVWEQESDGSWIVGSFSGIYRWNRSSQESIDYITQKPIKAVQGGMPSFENAICGFSNHFTQGPLIVDYNKGASFIDSNCPIPSMPDELRPGRISLWQVALEAHTGRLFIPHMMGSMLYIFVVGLLILIVFLSGYIVYKKRYVKKSPKKSKKNTQ